MRKKYGEQDLKTMNKQAENLRRILVQKKISQIRKILAEHGTPQAWLARKAGISATTMSEIVRGEVVPSLGTARKIARALGKSIEEIWPEEE